MYPVTVVFASAEVVGMVTVTTGTVTVDKDVPVRRTAAVVVRDRP